MNMSISMLHLHRLQQPIRPYIQPISLSIISVMISYCTFYCIQIAIKMLITTAQARSTTMAKLYIDLRPPSHHPSVSNQSKEQAGIKVIKHASSYYSFGDEHALDAIASTKSNYYNDNKEQNSGDIRLPRVEMQFMELEIPFTLQLSLVLTINNTDSAHSLYMHTFPIYSLSHIQPGHVLNTACIVITNQQQQQQQQQYGMQCLICRSDGSTDWFNDDKIRSNVDILKQTIAKCVNDDLDFMEALASNSSYSKDKGVVINMWSKYTINALTAVIGSVVLFWRCRWHSSRDISQI